MKKKIILTPEQRWLLEDLWFIYGNHGPKSNLTRHKFIQGILERGEDNRNFYKPDDEVLHKVDEILNNSKSLET